MEDRPESISYQIFFQIPFLPDSQRFFLFLMAPGGAIKFRNFWGQNHSYEYPHPSLDFLKLLFFFLVGYAILRTFHACLVQNSLLENSIDYIMIIDQLDSEWYFTPHPTQHMSFIFFPREFIFMIQIHSGKTDFKVNLETLSLALSLRNLLH